jgi:RimJ/RimL family protein N-acetyltransferase
MMITSSKIILTENDILKGRYIQLEPIEEKHREGLRIAANNEDIWLYMPQKAMNDLFDPWFNDCLDAMSTGTQIIYVVRRRNDQVIVGGTAYYDIQLENKRLTLGYSWYAPEVWGSVVNPEAKLLMLTQAFENWGLNRIEIGTDSRNLHSYNAIKKLGATEEGVLRQHMILHDDVVTDTIIFSILTMEWPNIKAQLIQRSSKFDGALLV